MMHAALVKKGIPTCLKIYKGEQHGFRKVRRSGMEQARDHMMTVIGSGKNLSISKLINAESTSYFQTLLTGREY